MVTWPVFGILQQQQQQHWQQMTDAQTLQTSKRHTAEVSAFHRYLRLVWGKTVRRIPEGYPKTRKMLFWDLAPLTLQNSGFFTIAPVFTSTLTVCRRNCGDPLSIAGLRVCYNYYRKKHSRSGLAWSRSRADRCLSRLTNVFRTTIDVCKM